MLVYFLCKVTISVSTEKVTQSLWNRCSLSFVTKYTVCD